MTDKPAMNKNMPKQIRAVALKIRPEKLIVHLVQGYSNNDIRLMIEIGKSNWLDYCQVQNQQINP